MSVCENDASLVQCGVSWPNLGVISAQCACALWLHAADDKILRCSKYIFQWWQGPTNVVYGLEKLYTPLCR